VIDTHCHILPGLDDGPVSMEDARAMAQVAVADGIRRMAATPHRRGWDVAATQDLAARLQQCQRELTAAGIHLTLAGGVEMMMSHDLLDRAGDERTHTLSGSRYLVVELPHGGYPLCTEDVMFDLELRGLVPILAHPERNAAIQDDLNLMAKLVNQGVLGQMTARSLLPDADRATHSTAQRLLKMGLVHLLATDGHDAERRPPRLAAGVQAAARVVGDRQAQAMVTAIPEAVLADREVAADMIRTPERVRWWSGIRLWQHAETG
jgi:protein-tyrosine phosphatase